MYPSCLLLLLLSALHTFFLLLVCGFLLAFQPFLCYVISNQRLFVDIMASSSTSSSTDVLLRNLSGTSIKLDGKNYIIWAKSIQVFLRTHKKIKHITQDPPDIKASEYDDWCYHVVGK